MSFQDIFPLPPRPGVTPWGTGIDPKQTLKDIGTTLLFWSGYLRLGNRAVLRNL